MSAASSTLNLHWCPVSEKSQLDSILTLKIGLKATLWKSSGERGLNFSRIVSSSLSPARLRVNILRVTRSRNMAVRILHVEYLFLIENGFISHFLLRADRKPQTFKL